MITSDDAGIIEQPRPLETLLKSTTYQGMTDDEIQRVIDWYAGDAYTRGKNDASIAAINDRYREMMERVDEIADRSEAAFNAAIASTVRFQTMGGDGNVAQ